MKAMMKEKFRGKYTKRFLGIDREADEMLDADIIVVVVVVVVAIGK